MNMNAGNLETKKESVRNSQRKNSFLKKLFSDTILKQELNKY